MEEDREGGHRNPVPSRMFPMLQSTSSNDDDDDDGDAEEDAVDEDNIVDVVP